MRSYHQAHLQSLGKMGWTFLGLAAFFIMGATVIPLPLLKTWLPNYSQEGTYVLSGLIAFLGLYCLGARWRKKY